MRLSRLFGLLALVLSAGSCLMTPTEEEILDDIEQSTKRKVRSAAGYWIGASPNLSLSFFLQEGVGDAVSGTGTMRETATGDSVRITLDGTYTQPELSLTIDGMVFEGHNVQGTFEGTYTSFIGITAPLRLAGPGYSREIEILLQEPADN